MYSKTHSKLYAFSTKNTHLRIFQHFEIKMCEMSLKSLPCNVRSSSISANLIFSRFFWYKYSNTKKNRFQNVSNSTFEKTCSLRNANEHLITLICFLLVCSILAVFLLLHNHINFFYLYFYPYLSK